MYNYLVLHIIFLLDGQYELLAVQYKLSVGGRQ